MSLPSHRRADAPSVSQFLRSLAAGWEGGAICRSHGGNRVALAHFGAVHSVPKGPRWRRRRSDLSCRRLTLVLYRSRPKLPLTERARRDRTHRGHRAGNRFDTALAMGRRRVTLLRFSARPWSS